MTWSRPSVVGTRMWPLGSPIVSTLWSFCLRYSPTKKALASSLPLLLDGCLTLSKPAPHALKFNLSLDALEEKRR